MRYAGDARARHAHTFELQFAQRERRGGLENITILNSYKRNVFFFLIFQIIDSNFSIDPNLVFEIVNEKKCGSK